MQGGMVVLLGDLFFNFFGVELAIDDLGVCFLEMTYSC